MKIEEIKPRHNNVLLNVITDPSIQDGIYNGVNKKNLRIETELYYGMLEQPQEKKTSDVAIFNRLAGFVVPTKDDYCKIIPEDQILAYMQVETKNIVPTANRVLVRTKKRSVINEDGVYNTEGVDRADADTAEGFVVATGVLVENLPINVRVCFDPWCGSLVTDTEDGESLLLIYDHDILFYNDNI